ncbi:MAG: DUF302 domain-containing protein [Fimbriimonadia bacterium]|jgi:uncharacterized protein (DUF302 family)
MSLEQVRRSGYGVSRSLTVPYEEAVERARAALANEGFGVLCEIDVREKLQEKLGVDFRRYVILGACNPALAHRALENELELGLLLPCNVIVYESEDGKGSVVAAVDANAMLGAVGGNPALVEVAAEVSRLLGRVLDRL